MKYTRWFKVNGENREFLHFYGSTEKQEIEECKQRIKAQGDIYRTTKLKSGFIEIWDARI